MPMIDVYDCEGTLDESGAPTQVRTSLTPLAANCQVSEGEG
jgi:hypothetical protein